MIRRFLVLPMLALAVALFAPSSAFAHDLQADVKVKDDVIYLVASYEGEDPAEGATVTLTDASGVVVATGKTNDKGVWTCPRPAPGTYTLVVEQAGHRDQKSVVVPGDGKTAEYSADRLDKRLGAAIGLGIVAVLSLLFWFFRRKPANGVAA